MFLTSTHALNMVLGMQGCGNGSCLFYNTSVIAEPKHFVVHSIPECGSVVCRTLLMCCNVIAYRHNLNQIVFDCGMS